MKFSNPICNDTEGYAKFVPPEYQFVCESDDWKNHSKTYKQSKDGPEDLPCCNVTNEHDKKGKGHEHFLDEARKSFMSGHSSFSFFCATFLVIYLHVRLSNDQVKDATLVKEGTLVARTLLR